MHNYTLISNRLQNCLSSVRLITSIFRQSLWSQTTKTLHGQLNGYFEGEIYLVIVSMFTQQLSNLGQLPNLSIEIPDYNYKLHVYLYPR